MLTEKYFNNIRQVLEKIRETQMDAIKRSAEIITDSLLNGGVWHVMDTGHMLMYEAIGRTGGLMAVRPVRISLEVNNPTRYREVAINKKRVFMDSIEGLPEYVINKSNIVTGDVLLVGSVSGINILPVEMAIYAKKKGICVIGLTSIKYSSYLNSKHRSGKKLFEVCDIVLDYCTEIGDTLVYIDELEQGICPASGIAASYIMWALQSWVIELMLARGKRPHVYKNNHLPGADEFNSQAWNEYEKMGY